MNRQNFISAPAFFELNTACRTIVEAYGVNLYLVGSSLVKRDFRDVDLRLILPDEQFDAMFPGIGSGWYLDARWSLLCSAISMWLSKHSSLPVDFQIQRQTQANEMEDKTKRHVIGLFLEPK